MFTHMVDNISFGVVDLSTLNAVVFESIMLYRLVARDVGDMKTWPHPVQCGIYLTVYNVKCSLHNLHCTLHIYYSPAGPTPRPTSRIP